MIDELAWLFVWIVWTLIVAAVAYIKGFDLGWDAATDLRDDMRAIMNRNPEARP